MENIQNNQKTELLLISTFRKLPKETSTQKTTYGIYKCFCGNQFISPIYSVNRGGTKSCGCYQSKIASEKCKLNNKKIFTTHNMSKTRLHNIWTGIKARCYNKKDTAFCYY